MTEKLLPCPFCGGEASVHRCEHAFHDAKIRCAGCQAEGPIFDVDDGEANEAGRNEAEAIAAWNRRTPAPEGEAILCRLCSMGLKECDCISEPLYASPVVPVPSGEPVAWFRQSRANRKRWYQVEEDEVDELRRIGTVVKPLYASPVVPVGVSEVLDAAAAYLKEQYGASYGLDHPVDRARIIAALRPTDTGRE